RGRSDRSPGSPEDRSQPPLRIGPYLLLEELGRGGMGVVYRAEHPDSGQRVALKSLHLPRQGSLAGLRREIHALSRIQHPGVARIVDHGVEQGLPWYAMELLEGTTLRRYRAALPTNDGTETPRSVPASEAMPATQAEPAPSGGERLQPLVLQTALTLVRRVCE